MAGSIGTLFMAGVGILTTVVDSVRKTISAQLGDVIAGSQTRSQAAVACDGAEWWQHVGFWSRPSPPTNSTCAQAFAVRQRDRDCVIATRDLRTTGIYASLQPGETCVFAGGADGLAQGRCLLKANGNVTMYTADGNVAGGQSVAIQCNSDSTINLASKYGSATLDANGWTLLAAGGKAGIQISAAGDITIIGATISLNSGNVQLGPNVGTGYQPVIWGPSGMAGVASTTVKVSI